MRFYDIFNGDADGLCALHQLRLAEPRQATLITGVKRDIGLLAWVSPQAGDMLTVLDVSLDTNREAVHDVLNRGAHVRYFDHHYAGEIPRHPRFESHIDTSADICTSLIVDRYLEGRFRAWAVVAAFGDNLRSQAYSLASLLGLTDPDAGMLRALGEALNYNAYGESIEDLHFHPEQLYRRMQPYADPLEFCAQASELDQLRQASADDLEKALALPIEAVGAAAVAVFLPEAPWSRRVAGVFANELSLQHTDRTVALLVRKGAGFQVSLRAPEHSAAPIHLLARQFESGNGRARSAGIQFLPDEDLARLFALLRNSGVGRAADAPQDHA